MDSVPGYRACFECCCDAYRWQRTAAQKGETHCLQCGTPFASAQLRFYPKVRGGGQMLPAAGQRCYGQRPGGAWKGGSGAKGALGKGGKG